MQEGVFGVPIGNLRLPFLWCQNNNCLRRKVDSGERQDLLVASLDDLWANLVKLGVMNNVEAELDFF